MFQGKSIKLGQMTTLNVIFHVVVSIYRLVKIWNSPQFPVQFRNGQLANELVSHPGGVKNSHSRNIT